MVFDDAFLRYLGSEVVERKKLNNDRPESPKTKAEKRGRKTTLRNRVHSGKRSIFRFAGSNYHEGNGCCEAGRWVRCKLCRSRRPTGGEGRADLLVVLS